MQKLNARDIYVLVIIALLTVVLSVMLTLELVSEYSSLRTVEDDSISINRKDLINNINTFFQIVLGIAAFISILRVRRTGWIIALPLLTLFTTVSGILLFSALGAGLLDVAVLIGGIIWLFFFVSIIFLLLPGTLRKFNVGKRAVIPAIILFVFLVSVYFIVR